MSSIRPAFQRWLQGYECTCTPVDDPGQSRVLLRPAVLYGEPRAGCPVLIGLNPSRRFTIMDLASDNLTITQYKWLLSFGDQFEKFYSKITGKPLYTPGTLSGRDSHSRIQYLIHELVQRHGGVMVTNYYAYPSGTTDKLKTILRTGRTIPSFQASICGHLPELLRLANQDKPICLGTDTIKLCRGLTTALTPLRHPSGMADRNWKFPNRLTWEQAAASAVSS